MKILTVGPISFGLLSVAENCKIVAFLDEAHIKVVMDYYKRISYGYELSSNFIAKGISGRYESLKNKSYIQIYQESLDTPVATYEGWQHPKDLLFICFISESLYPIAKEGINRSTFDEIIIVK